MRKLCAGLAPLLLLAALAACDSASPVAPEGTRLTIAAAPSEIGVQGQSVITVVGTRANGAAVPKGTEIRLSSTLGQIPEVVETDESGVAKGVLAGTGRSGTATVTATSGSAEAVTVDVVIGIGAEKLSLVASPSTIGNSGGTIQLRALARDAEGEPLSGVPVVFSAEVGSLQSGGAVVRTDDDGLANDRLRVNESELATLVDQELQVRADAGAATASLDIRVFGPPEANFTTQKSGFTVIFTDTSKGVPTAWQWDFGDGFTSNLQNPTHTYASAGTYTVTLTARNSEGASSKSQFLTVP